MIAKESLTRFVQAGGVCLGLFLFLVACEKQNSNRLPRPLDPTSIFKRHDFPHLLNPKTYMESYMGDPFTDNFNTGVYNFAHGAGDDVGRAAVFQSDGKILIAGRTDNGTHNDYLIARIWLDGSFDTTFGTAGKVVTSWAQGEAIIHAMAVETTGKIVVGGRRWGLFDYDFGFARYNTDGTLDTSFGASGESRVDFGNHDFMRALAIDSLGRIVGYGHTKNASYDLALTRLTAQGQLDTAFGTAGITTIGTAEDDLGYAMAIDSLNQVHIAARIFSTNPQFAGVRYSEAGALQLARLHNFGAGDDTPYAMTLNGTQPVLAGRAHNGANYDFAIVEFNATYTGNIFATQTTMGTRSENIRHVQVLSDGKFLATGSQGNGTDWDFALARYGTGGILDTAYGTGGKVSTDCNGGAHDRGFGLAYQAGKSVMIGRTGTDGSYDICVARYNLDGSLAVSSDLDQFYQQNGFVVAISTNAGAESGFNMEIDSAGRAVVTGQSNNGLGLARFNTDGTLDATFSGDGLHSEIINASAGDFAYGMALQDDGKILLAGFDNNNFLVSRFTTSGVLDATFATAGSFSQIVGGGFLSYGTAVTLDQNQDIIAAGSGVNVLEDFIILRLTTGGTLDTAFNGTGSNSVNVGGSLELAFDAIQTPDDKTVIAGYVLNTDWEFGVARFHTDGTLDTNFGPGGSRMIDMGANTQDFAWRLNQDADGKIYIMGACNNDFCVLRLNSDGTTDTSFGTSGSVIQNISGNDFAYDMDFQGNGKILVSGAAGGEMGFMRLHTNGSLDTSFSLDGVAQVNVAAGASNALGVAIRSDGRILAGGTCNDGAGNGFCTAQIYP